MRITVFAFLLFLLIPNVSHSLELDAVQIYPNIIESLKADEKGWFIHGNDLIFAKPEHVKELSKESYPDMDIRAIVVLTYNLFYNNGYVMIEKPMKSSNIPDEYEKQLLHEIKIRVFEKLYSQGIRRRVEVKKPVQKPIEEKKPEPKDGMIKIEATGRKL